MGFISFLLVAFCLALCNLDVGNAHMGIIHGKPKCYGVKLGGICFSLSSKSQSYYANIYECAMKKGRLAFINTKARASGIQAWLQNQTEIFGEFVWTGGFSQLTNPSSLSDFVWMCGNDISKSPKVTSGYTGHINSAAPTSSCLAYQIKEQTPIEQIMSMNCMVSAYGICETPPYRGDVCNADYGSTGTKAAPPTTTVITTTNNMPTSEQPTTVPITITTEAAMQMQTTPAPMVMETTSAQMVMVTTKTQAYATTKAPIVANEQAGAYSLKSCSILSLSGLYLVFVYCRH